MNTLYLPSTPLNALVSLAHYDQTAATTANTNRARLWWIDEKNASPLLSILNAWPRNPFEEIASFSGARRERRGVLRKLSDKARNFAPDRLAVGSDRRLEFQWLHHCTKPQHAVYLDDGLYSYHYKNPAYKRITNYALKRAVYGAWVREPAFIGASDLITESFLFAPEHALAAITAKPHTRIAPATFQHGALRAFCEYALHTETRQDGGIYPQALTDIDMLVVLAHPVHIARNPAYIANITALLAANRDKRIAVKYHPRYTHDAFDLLSKGANLCLPAHLPLEVFYPFLPDGMALYGDITTSLLTARWLRPDFTITAQLSASNPHQRRYIPLMERIGIAVKAP